MDFTIDSITTIIDILRKQYSLIGNDSNRLQEKREKTTLLHRMTIDEKISIDICRVLYSECQFEGKSININSKEWTEELEVYISNNPLHESSSFSIVQINDINMDSLSEGEVYLAGKFIIDNDDEDRRILHKSEEFIVMRVDHLIKSNVRKLYENALTRGGDHADSNIK